jgi:integrative and conjugative element protein (TIGR02256 family)
MTEALSAAMPDPFEFTEAGIEGASVWISPDAVQSMLDASVKARCRETGGILIGRYGPGGWVADVVEATPKPRGSRSGWFWFQRSNEGLAALLEERWREGYHYLGEWHFHPRGSPTPSGNDRRAMAKIALDDVYRCPEPILVILGGRPKSDWSLSATLFRDGRAVELFRRMLD